MYYTLSSYQYSDEQVAEVNDGTLVTDVTGYIDPETQITNMLLAGQTLDQQRAGIYEYDTDDPDEDPEMDPTRDIAYDHVDAQRSMEVLNEKAKKSGNKVRPPDSLEKEDVQAEQKDASVPGEENI